MLLGAFYVFGQARSDSDLLLIIGTLPRMQDVLHMGMASGLAVVGRRYTGTALQHPSIARHKPFMRPSHSTALRRFVGRPMRSAVGAGLGVDGGPGGDGGAAAQATRSDEHVHR